VILDAAVSLLEWIRLSGASQPSILFSYGAAPRDMSEALNHIASGRVRVDDLVTHRFPLNRIGEAFDLVANPRDTSLKIIIEPHRRP